MPLDVTRHHLTRRAWVPLSPARAYDLLSEVSHISRWSPNAVRAAYDEGAGPHAGAWFHGRNRRDGAEWDSRSQVQVTQPGREFAYTVLGSEGSPVVRWTWTFTPYATGTALTQSWQLLAYDPVLGTTPQDLDTLREATADSMESTLTALSAWASAHG
ncbi:SRPBCC family protein [Streptomyces sp. SID11385]|uniref:SRPBCC family protein n=1 Tax=Streptomyces sp. SID11385 TaxID=2706031 RepID=UPI0013C78CCF|nr:SRPBCC family protein [Streptomyces sp. SID11385]NEA39550.1 SRPBCC family protein [Streptomyces sp. SID11385]